MSVDRLILGTAGLGGLPYGRNGRAVSAADAAAIIEHAYARGFRAFDTAPSYGFAEKALGQVLRRTGGNYTVFTKTTGSDTELIQTIRDLGCTPLVLWHNLKKGERLLPWCSGFTTYSDFENLASYVEAGITVQVDWNILNQRASFAPILRSVYLQGCLAGEQAPVSRLQPYIDRARLYADGLGLSLRQLSLFAALECNDQTSRVVVGPTSIAEVDECCQLAEMKRCRLFPAIKALDVEERDLTDPRKWVA